VKLRHLERWTEERRTRAAEYTRALEEVPGLTLPREREGARSAWHLYTIRAPERDRLKEHLRERGIASAVHYPRPIHLQPSMATAGAQEGDLPVSEQISREVLCLPIYPELPDEDVRRIAGEVRAFLLNRG
ncbi:MAG: DegT/DnrJ/EryC1/StrS family aminotransferase, partial [Vicinamibacteria bacterium]